MNKPSFLIVFVSLMFLMSSLSFPLHNFVSLADGQQQPAITTSSKNVTDLIKSNGKNSSLQLENKTVNYFENASGYLVHPTLSSSSIENNVSVNNNINNNNTTFPAVVMIHENKGLNDN